MLHQCVQARAMTAPSCSMHTQIHPQSSPRRLKMAPHGAQGEPPSLPHLLPVSSKPLCLQTFRVFPSVAAFVHLYVLSICRETGHDTPTLSPCGSKRLDPRHFFPHQTSKPPNLFTTNPQSLLFYKKQSGGNLLSTVLRGPGPKNCSRAGGTHRPLEAS